MTNKRLLFQTEIQLSSCIHSACRPVTSTNIFPRSTNFLSQQSFSNIWALEVRANTMKRLTSLKFAGAYTICKAQDMHCARSICLQHMKVDVITVSARFMRKASQPFQCSKCKETEKFIDNYKNHTSPQPFASYKPARQTGCTTLIEISTGALQRLESRIAS